MGSGDRFQFYKSDGSWGMGVFVSRFPFALTIGVSLVLWNIQLGFGRAYDA